MAAAVAQRWAPAEAAEDQVAQPHLRRTRAPREMRTEDWTALSIVTSGLTATLARWSQATQSADVAEAEVPTWERQMAAATVSRFCEAL